MAKATAEHYVFLRVRVAVPPSGVVPTQEGVERWIRDTLQASPPQIEPAGGWYVDRAETFDAMGNRRDS
jgi:hypothetical protein